MRRAERLCLLGLAASGIYTLAMLPVAPSLLGSDPVLLELLRGSTPAMVSGGAFARVGQASLLLALLAPLPTLLMTDPLLWWAGRLWGPKAVGRLAGISPRSQGRLDRAQRVVGRYESGAIVLAYFLPVPSALIYAGAGWAGMSLKRFVLLDLAGTALWVATNVALGYAIGQSAVDVAKAVSRYGLYVSLALVAVAVVLGARRAAAEPA